MKIGIDIGSVSVKLVVLDDKNVIKKHVYCRTHGQPIEILLLLLKDLAKSYPSDEFSVAATGSGGKLVSEVCGIGFVNEVTAHAVGTGTDYPKVRCVIEIGGEDAKLIHISEKEERKNNEVKEHVSVIDFATNTVCAAGTGSFLDQQASRLGIAIENFGSVVMKSVNPPRVAGRCSVFAKTDMIHLQQVGTPVEDIAAGLCYAMARNFRSNVIKGSHLEKPVAFQGGVAANQGMIRAFRDVLELAENDLVIPENFALRGAIGAIYESSHVQSLKSSTVRKLIDKLEEYVKGRRIDLKTLEPLVGDNYPINIQTHPLKSGQKTQGYLGIDVGSISTNVVVIDKDNNVLSRRYLMTAGRPIEAVRQGLAEVGKDVGDFVEIKACGSTGSGRYMTGAFFGADAIKNEITSHAKGAVAMDPKVDTIFEIGGQDAKYISISNGVIVDFTMNKVCAAGTGSFLEEQAEKLAIKLDQEFGARALNSKAPLDLGERCTVFMESQLNYYKQQGMVKDDLLAGLAYSIATNYLNRVVEKHKIGNHILFQGGVAFNRSVKAAFEKVVGKKIIVPPHHDILGAVGAAIIAREETVGKQTAFKGFDLSKRTYQSSSFECQGCPNNCEIRRVVFEKEKPMFYGSRCGKFDDTEVKKARQTNPLPQLFKEREEKLIGNLKPEAKGSKRVGIPRSAMFFDLAPLWISFFQGLGFEVVLSDPTNRTIIKKGVENVLAEPCFPIKTAHGHILNLLDKSIDYLFLPVQVNMPKLAPDFVRSYNCPYVQSLPYTAESSIPFLEYNVKILKTVFEMARGKRFIVKAFESLAQEAGIKDRRVISRAIESAFKAHDEFNRWMVKRGREVLNNLKPNEKAIVLVGRPYNTSDPGLTLDLPERLREQGILAIPIDFLPMEELGREISGDYPYMYWKSGQRMLTAGRMVARDKRLFAIYITNFGCGPDSYITKFFEREMSSKGGSASGGHCKPFMVLEIDEHSSDVGVMTRCEAFLDTIRHSESLAETNLIQMHSFIPSRKNGRTIYIPYMGDHSHTFAAAIRSQGIPSESLPLSDEKSLSFGRKFTTGKECFPSIITTGDIVKKVNENGFKRDKSAFFMPAAQGPCRFGQYNKLHRMVLDSLEYDDIPIMLFDQIDCYHKDVAALGKSSFKRMAWRGFVMIDLMQKMMMGIRPHEVNKGESDYVYKESLEELTGRMEKNSDLASFAAQTRHRFAQVKTDPTIKKPKIGVVGEIYVRNNPFANDFMVRKLESLGAEVSLPPMEEWVDYLDYCRKGTYLTNKDYKHYLAQRIAEFVQEYDANRLRKGFKGAIRDFPLEDSMEKVIHCGGCYISPAILGESILSMGRAVEYAKKGFHGIVNVIPFGCMPGIVVTAILKQFRDDYPDIPIITLTVDGVKDPGGEMRLEAFVQQCCDNM